MKNFNKHKKNRQSEKYEIIMEAQKDEIIDIY